MNTNVFWWHVACLCFLYKKASHAAQRSHQTPPPSSTLLHRTQLAQSGVPKALVLHRDYEETTWWAITTPLLENNNAEQGEAGRQASNQSPFPHRTNGGVWQPTPKGVVTTKGANVFEPYRSAGRSTEMIQFVPGRSRCRRGCSAAIWLCFRPLSHYVPRQSPEKQVKEVRTDLKYLWRGIIDFFARLTFLFSLLTRGLMNRPVPDFKSIPARSHTNPLLMLFKKTLDYKYMSLTAKIFLIELVRVMKSCLSFSIICLCFKPNQTETFLSQWLSDRHSLELIQC